MICNRRFAGSSAISCTALVDMQIQTGKEPSTPARPRRFDHIAQFLGALCHLLMRSPGGAVTNLMASQAMATSPGLGAKGFYSCTLMCMGWLVYLIRFTLVQRMGSGCYNSRDV